MKSLPSDVVAYKRTPEFSDSSIPKGLLAAHSTKEGAWAQIIVLEGRLTYRILEPQVEELVIDEHKRGVIEPGILHEVAPLGPVRFYVQFFKAPD